MVQDGRLVCDCKLDTCNFGGPLKSLSRDETSFYFHPKTKEVIALTGSRNVYEVEQPPGKQNITVMFAFGASGVVVPPHVILPGQRIRKEVAQGFPANWGLGQSDRGWMDTHNFREYIVKIFHPFLVEQGVLFPVIFFVDGHASHKTLEVADVCQSLGIVLISLYPKTTHITQPADVAVFRPLKNEWRKSVEEWRYEHQGSSLTMMHFGSVLAKAVKNGIIPETIKNGFRVCGIYPFDPNAVDYSKCIVKATSIKDTSAMSVETAKETMLTNLPETLKTQEISYPTDQNCDAEPNVSISMDRIIEAYDLIGAHTIAKIEGNVNLLTREERIIRYFHREIVRPHIKFHGLSSSTENGTSSFMQVERDRDTDAVEEYVFGSPKPMDIDINDCEIINVDDVSTCCSMVAESTSGQPIENTLEKSFDIRFDNEESIYLRELATTGTETDDLAQFKNDTAKNFKNNKTLHNNTVLIDGMLQEVKNKTETTVRRRLSDVFKVPPTPRRSCRHRNYVRKFQPILTAGQRLEEIRKEEEVKMEKEQQKKRKALERQEAKIQREEAKRARLEEREREKKS
ncbi:uncharacterized protein LOC129767345 isoform X1 [Toxorhynchites rutilus septentrionalis]|uniref:uncharacterized protein LOC129767345 isoform X1 n=1 Tax=Toxorhynchites rutilus septentrionalis TaxID=329112 RepID=UPI002479E29E|nr:uncharacterized protein LOC129767345 isoform X1 [Toxorhynchites rutilus septentrionalis]